MRDELTKISERLKEIAIEVNKDNQTKDMLNSVAFVIAIAEPTGEEFVDKQGFQVELKVATSGKKSAIGKMLHKAFVNAVAE